MITKFNYEIYIVDYIDGTLDEKQKVELENFLEIHPEIADEFSIFKASEKLNSEQLSFPKKDSLFKHRFECDDELEAQIIAACEHDLNDESLEELDFFIQNNEKADYLYHIHQQIKFEPDTNIQYPHKKELLQRKKAPIFYLRPLIAAASVAVIAIIFFMPRQELQTVYTAQSDLIVLESETLNPTININLLKTETAKIEIQKQRIKTKPQVLPIIAKTDEKESIKIDPKKIERPKFDNELQKPKSTGAEILEQVIISSDELALSEIPLRDNTTEETTAKNNENFGSMGVQKLADATLVGLKKISNKKFDYKQDNKGKVKSIKLKVKRPKLPPLLAYNNRK